MDQRFKKQALKVEIFGWLFVIFIVACLGLKSFQATDTIPPNNSRSILSFIDNDTSNGSCISISSCIDKCHCAKLNAKSSVEACRIDHGLIDYLDVYYCTMESIPVLAIIGFVSFIVINCMNTISNGLQCEICWCVFLFYLLVSTTEDYFCASLSKISEKLKLSNNVAGVTLLAFGNGSPGNSTDPYPS
jgi:hypothetical protein